MFKYNYAFLFKQTYIYTTIDIYIYIYIYIYILKSNTKKMNVNNIKDIESQTFLNNKKLTNNNKNIRNKFINKLSNNKYVKKAKKDFKKIFKKNNNDDDDDDDNDPNNKNNNEKVKIDSFEPTFYLTNEQENDEYNLIRIFIRSYIITLQWTLILTSIFFITLYMSSVGTFLNGADFNFLLNGVINAFSSLTKSVSSGISG